MSSKWDGVDVSQIIFAKNLEIQELKAKNAVLREALKKSQHELHSIHGLFASDDPALIDHTPSGVWRLDVSATNHLIDAALERQEQGKS